MIQSKPNKTIEVLVILTPAQLRAIHRETPGELSFTRQLVTWNISGRKMRTLGAKSVQDDPDGLWVEPDDALVPAFYIKAK